MSASGEGWYADPQDPARLRWWDGAQWTDRTMPLVRTSHWGPPLKRSWLRVALVLQFALAAYIATATFTIYAALETLSFVEEVRLRPDTVSVEDGEWIDTLALWSLLEIPTTLVAGVLFIVWLYTVHHSDRMDRLVLKHGSGWAIGGWFVPIMNMWRPFQMVTDVRRGATGDRDAAATHRQGWWWGTWILSNVLMGVVAYYYGVAYDAPDPQFVDALGTAASWELAACVANILAAIFAILVVQQVTTLAAAPRRPAEDRAQIPAQTP